MNRSTSIVLELRRVCACVGSVQLLDDVSVSISGGEFVTIIGRNGAGKSSLLKACFRGIRISSGQIRLDSKDLSDLSQREVAQCLAYVPQGLDLLAPLSVAEFVRISCYPYFYAKRGRIDDSGILSALDRLDMSRYFARPLNSLSGGERQRVLLAAAMVGRAKIIMLDEPTTYLDPAAQSELFAALQTLRAELGSAVIMVSHHLTAAKRVSDRIIAMSHGKIVGNGDPDQILSAEMLASVFGCEFDGLSAVF